jgi:hypothetical protein
MLLQSYSRCICSFSFLDLLSYREAVTVYIVSRVPARSRGSRDLRVVDLVLVIVVSVAEEVDLGAECVCSFSLL